MDETDHKRQPAKFRIAGQEFEFKFASLGLVKKAAATLGCQILRGLPSGDEILSIMEDEKKVLEFYKLVSEKEVPEDLYDRVTVSEFNEALVDFFFAVWIDKGRPMNGEADLQDTINTLKEKLHQKLMSSTLPSSLPETATQKS